MVAATPSPLTGCSCVSSLTCAAGWSSTLTNYSCASPACAADHSPSYSLMDSQCSWSSVTWPPSLPCLPDPCLMSLELELAFSHCPSWWWGSHYRPSHSSSWNILSIISQCHPMCMPFIIMFLLVSYTHRWRKDRSNIIFAGSQLEIKPIFCNFRPEIAAN